MGPVDQVALCDGAFCLSIFRTGVVLLWWLLDAWLLGLIGRPSSGDGFGREVLLLLALCHDHHHRHCRRHVENVPLFVLLLLLLPIVSVLYSVCACVCC